MVYTRIIIFEMYFAYKSYNAESEISAGLHVHVCRSASACSKSALSNRLKKGKNKFPFYYCYCSLLVRVYKH